MLVEATRKGEGEEKRRSRVTRGRRQERGRARAMYAEEGPAAAAAGPASPSCGVAFVTVNGFF